MTHLYVASSWRNPLYDSVIERVTAESISHYDFKNPPGRTGFAWSEIDPDWQAWSARRYIELLNHPIAQAGYASDMDAMDAADVFLLVLPAGRSAHLELGWAAGSGRSTIILTRDGEEPELMAKMADLITDSLDEAIAFIHDLDAPEAPDLLGALDRSVIRARAGRR